MRRIPPLPSTLAWLGGLCLCSFGIGCGQTGGFTDNGTPGLRDVGFGSPDAEPGPDGGVDTPDTGEPPPDVGPRPDAGPQPDATPGVDTGVPPSRPTFSEQVIDNGIRHGQGLEVADVDGDGDLDVVASLSLTDAVHLYVNDGGGRFSQVSIGGGIVAMETAVADLDGDGDLDIAAVGLFERSGGFTSPGEVVWYENPGSVTGSWTRHDITGFTFWGGLYIEAGDLTGDGAADLVVGAIQLSDTNGDPQGNGVYWFRNTGGSFVGPTAVDANLLEVTAVHLADVDGNATLDVIAVGGASSEVAWWANGRDPATPRDDPPFTKHVIGTPSGPYGMHYANLDDDPERELLVTSADQGGGVVYFDPPADVSAAWASVSVASGLGDAVASRVYAADFDDDGRVDVATGFASSGSVAVFYQGAAGFEAAVVRGGYAGLNWLTGGDLNGDQRVDLLTATYEQTGSSDVIAWWRSE